MTSPFTEEHLVERPPLLLGEGPGVRVRSAAQLA
jgi:hypothetical protein